MTSLVEITKFQPESKYYYEDIEMSNAPSWMIELIKMNPNYTSWESSCSKFKSFDDFKKEWGNICDDLNEVVHFYFSIEYFIDSCPRCLKKRMSKGMNMEERNKVQCKHCNSTGCQKTSTTECYLVLWVIQPRKTMGKTLKIKIEKDDVFKAIEILEKAKNRLSENFSRLNFSSLIKD